MEEQADLRRQLKLLESKNTTLMQSNIDLEEDIKKAGNTYFDFTNFPLFFTISVMYIRGLYYTYVF